HRGALASRVVPGPACALLCRSPCFDPLRFPKFRDPMIMTRSLDLHDQTRRNEMAGDKAEVLVRAPKRTIVEGLGEALTVHKLWEAKDPAALIAAIAPRVSAIASPGGHAPVDSGLMSRLPNLKIVSSFGVGYDHVDAKWAGAHGIVVTNTPDVLTEE